MAVSTRISATAEITREYGQFGGVQPLTFFKKKLPLVLLAKLNMKRVSIKVIWTRRRNAAFLRTPLKPILDNHNGMKLSRTYSRIK